VERHTGTEVVSLSAALSIYRKFRQLRDRIATVNYSHSAIDLGTGAQTAFNRGCGGMPLPWVRKWVQVDLAIDQSISEIQFYIITAQSP